MFILGVVVVVFVLFFFVHINTICYSIGGKWNAWVCKVYKEARNITQVKNSGLKNVWNDKGWTIVKGNVNWKTLVRSATLFIFCCENVEKVSLM